MNKLTNSFKMIFQYPYYANGYLVEYSPHEITIFFIKMNRNK